MHLIILILVFNCIFVNKPGTILRHVTKETLMRRPYYINIRSNLELNFTEVFVFAMMFEPEDIFGLFTYVSIRTRTDDYFPYITCLYINCSFIVCYR